jgi:uncharacterized protein (TIGR04255 family)
MTNPKTLPSFERPPVIETVLGVQFERLPQFRNAHLGLFWSFVRDNWSSDSVSDIDWAHVRDAPPIEPAYEQFASRRDWTAIGRGLRIGFTQDPATRILVRNEDKDRQIQLQNGRLHYNWLGHSGGAYPRFSAVMPEFAHTLKLLERFVDQHGLGAIKPDQWEVTYVNHIQLGTVWSKPSDWTELFRGMAGIPADTPGIRLESFGSEWHYEIPERRGRLHVQLARRESEDREEADFLRMTLTARGPTGGVGLTLDGGLDLGHETIVQAFADMTSDKAHRYWGRRT